MSRVMPKADYTPDVEVFRELTPWQRFAYAVLQDAALRYAQRIEKHGETVANLRDFLCDDTCIHGTFGIDGEWARELIVEPIDAGRATRSSTRERASQKTAQQRNADRSRRQRRARRRAEVCGALERSATFEEAAAAAGFKVAYKLREACERYEIEIPSHLEETTTQWTSRLDAGPPST